MGKWLELWYSALLWQEEGPNILGLVKALALQHVVLARKGFGAMTDSAADNHSEQTVPVVSLNRLEEEWRQLLPLIAQGDQEALGIFYDATSPLVYGLALRILGDTAVAEEVTIDVYTYVWRQAESYVSARGTPTAWLFMLTRSRALDRLRARAQQQKLLHAMEEIDSASCLTTPEESLVLNERQRLVQEAFIKLVPEQRQVIELSYFAGLSHSDIATRLGLPLGTVKTRLRLGMLKLRDLLYPLVE